MRDLQKVSALFSLKLYFIDDYKNKIHHYRIIIVNTIQCDSICIYLLPLYVLVSWPSSEGMRSTCLGNAITWFVIHTSELLYESYLQLFGLKTY
jgi:hypothetical protein